jgi:hypothetical protein
MSIGAISYNTNSVAFNSLLFAFRYFNAILSLRVSFLFLLVVVLLVEGKGPRCSNGEFDSCDIRVHVALLQEGTYTSSILTASWITAAGG